MEKSLFWIRIAVYVLFAINTVLRIIKGTIDWTFILNAVVVAGLVITHIIEAVNKRK